MTEVKKHRALHKIRQVGRADDYEREIAEVRSFESGRSLVTRYHRRAQARARDFVESFFWLGAAVARVHTVSGYGDNAIGRLSQESGIHEGTLREAMGFFDTFAGSFEAMYVWVSEWIDDHGKLLKGDVKRLVAANRERRAAGVSVRRYNAVLDEAREHQYDWVEGKADKTIRDIEALPLNEPRKLPRKKSEPHLLYAACKRLQGRDVDFVEVELPSLGFTVYVVQTGREPGGRHEPGGSIPVEIALGGDHA